MKDKRKYRRWSPEERHTALTVLRLFGNKHQGKIVEYLEDRNENQVRSFINKAFEPEYIKAIVSGEEVSTPPPGYVPPPKLQQEILRRAMVAEEQRRPQLHAKKAHDCEFQCHTHLLEQDTIAVNNGLLRGLEGNISTLLHSVDRTNTTNDLVYAPSSSSLSGPYGGFTKHSTLPFALPQQDLPLEFVSKVAPRRGMGWGALVGLAA